MAAASPLFHDSRSLVVDQSEIVSSQELSLEEKKITTANYRQKRVVIINVPTIITSYVFKTSPVIKSYILADPGKLACLPIGYTIC